MHRRTKWRCVCLLYPLKSLLFSTFFLSLFYSCVVRCRNPARAGPFGGCAVVTNAGSANTTNTTASGTETAAVEASTTAAAAESTTTATGAATANKKKGKRQGLVARFVDYFNNEDLSRRKVVGSRIVDEQKRGLWI